jgi:hypothetical protein
MVLGRHVTISQLIRGPGHTHTHTHTHTTLRVHGLNVLGEESGGQGSVVNIA